MGSDILEYNHSQDPYYAQICDLLLSVINEALTQAQYKIWHAHPVWFINENPIVGYSKQKKGIRLMFWSGADFEEDILTERGKKFKDASIFYQTLEEVVIDDIKRCLEKSKYIQWDYKNIVKRKGVLIRL